ncbi:response regulator transcription factor [Vulcanococcus sp. Clear-D1]|uniref:response regulator transcription factor n=1 Tax=Vulcanococcus sp. Clear-D1 TaxID=2766970 RepID=UPI0025D02E6B|nr:response regulator transcription factor [Vulcanococcus sp. Clear-D1]
MSVVVLDDHRMVGQAIAGVLSEVAGLNVTGVCVSVQEVVALINCSPPRLLVVDVELGGECYRDAVDPLLQRRPEAELLFITAMASQFVPPADLQPFTIGVMDKAQAWDQLLAVLMPWKQGLCGGITAAMQGCELQLAAIDRLSPRERRLVRELGCGLLNKEIAARLELSVATVETYRKSVAAKLGVSGAELVRLATLHRTLRWDAGSPAAV